MTTEQSPLVQRAVQRLRDGITRREMNLDLEAIKAVLVEMANQKDRADRLHIERDELLSDVRHLNGAMVEAEEALAENRRLAQERGKLIEALRSGIASLEQFVKLGRIPENNQGLREMRAALRACGECGCIETFPQLVAGKVSHGPGCKE